MSQTQGKRWMLSSGIEDDSRYLKLKEQMGFEGEGVFWAAYRTIRKNGGLYPYRLLVDLLKCHRTPAKRVRHVLEDFGLFKVNTADGISIALTTKEQKIRALLAWSLRNNETTKEQTNDGIE